MTAVEFYDRSPIENVISSLTTAPDKIIFIGEENLMEKQKKTYERFIAVVLLPSPLIELVTPIIGHFTPSGRVNDRLVLSNLYCSIPANPRFSCNAFFSSFAKSKGDFECFLCLIIISLTFNYFSFYANHYNYSRKSFPSPHRDTESWQE